MSNNSNLENKISVKNEIKSLFFVIIIAILIRVFLIEFFYVPTGSMKDTIFIGDYIFSTKFSYGYSNYSIPFSPDLFKERVFPELPNRGDIVIFRPTEEIKEDRFIKRLIGLPGDIIQIIDDVIYINDVPIERKSLGKVTDEEGNIYEKFEEILPGGVKYHAYYEEGKEPKILKFLANYGPVYVQPGHYFFLGDNRYNSNDSRFDLGIVPFKNFIAKAHYVVFSTASELWGGKNIREQFNRIINWPLSIRFSRMFHKLDS